MESVKQRKVALYVRTSTDMQEKGHDAQRRALEAYCLQKGIIDYLLFEDFGVSGTKQTRPGLDKLMQAARASEISCVVVYSFSRFARSTVHLLNALDEFNKLQVGFISISESIDSSTPIGRTMFTIISSISQLEAELIRERVKNGIKAARERGRQIGAIRKYDNPELFFQLRSNGMTVRQIAKTIKCSTATVVRMLKHKPVSMYQKSSIS